MNGPGIHVERQFGTIPVLVAEDNVLNQEVMLDLLEDSLYLPSIAVDGLDTLAQFRGSRFGAVLLDCDMPRMNGLEVCRSIRQFEHEAGLPRTPIIAVTANAMHGDRDRCLAAGMDDYLSKPFAHDELMAVLARWVVATRKA